VDIRLAELRLDGLRLRDLNRDLAPDARKRIGDEDGRPGGHTRPQEADPRQAGSTQA